jgi:hypothetical protein
VQIRHRSRGRVDLLCVRAQPSTMTARGSEGLWARVRHKTTGNILCRSGSSVRIIATQRRPCIKVGAQSIHAKLKPRFVSRNLARARIAYLALTASSRNSVEKYLRSMIQDRVFFFRCLFYRLAVGSALSSWPGQPIGPPGAESIGIRAGLPALLSLLESWHW